MIGQSKKESILPKLMPFGMVLLSAITLSAHAEEEIPQIALPKYEIVKNIADDSLDLNWISGEHYEYSLKLEGSKEALFLARGYEESKNGVAHPAYGFDPQSFKLIWVISGEWLHAAWETVRQGSGAYTMATDLVIGKNEEDWHIVFRDTRERYSRGNLADASGTRFEIESGSKKETCAIKITLWSIYCWRKEHEPDADTLLTTQWIGDDGDTWFGREEHRIRRYPFTIGNGVMVIEPGKESLYFPDKEFAIADAAAYLGVAEDYIKKLNPKIEEAGVCSGELLVYENIPPYVPNEHHSYGGGQ